MRLENLRVISGLVPRRESSVPDLLSQPVLAAGGFSRQIFL